MTARRAADRAALVLRAVTAFSLALLTGLITRPAGSLLGSRPLAAPVTAILTILAVLVVIGLFTRAAAAALSLAALSFLCVEIRSRAEWFSLPVRNAELFILFGALALTGGGPLSIDRAFRHGESGRRNAAGTNRRA